MADLITYDDKVSLTTSEIPRINKCTDADLNEIKSVVNANANLLDSTNSLASKVNTTIVTTANTDLKDYIENGIYYFSSSVTPISIPAGVNGWLRVMKGNQNNVVKQIWYRHGTNNSNDFETYVRTLNGSAGWSNWQRQMVENDLYYKDGDSFTLNWAGGGFLTTSSTEIQFSIPLSKRVKDTIEPTITAGQLYVRKSSGGYLLNNVSILTDNNITINAYENILTIRLVHSTAYSETNNISLAIQVSGLKIEFTEPHTPGPIS